MFKIGFMPNQKMLGWEPEKLCDYVKEAGYEAIELQAQLVCAEGKTEKERKRLLCAVEKSGLVISEIVLQRDFVLTEKEAREKNIEYVIKNMQTAADMGVDTVNVFTGPEPWVERPLIINKNISSSQAWGYVFEAFDRLLPVAEKTKTRLAVENVFGMLCHDFYTNMYLNNHYSSCWLGVNLDPSHDVLYSNTDMKFLVLGWGKDKIFHVHLKDAAGIPEMGRFIFPIIGEGQVDWATFFAELQNIGHEGCASVEFESFAYIKSGLDGCFEKSAELSRRVISNLMEGI